MSKRSNAGLSLDLDNLWSYMRIHGDSGWDTFPSYLDVVVPRFLEFLRDRDLLITVFIVGKDATIDGNHPALRSIVGAGHEVGNHSHMHEPWLHRYSDAEIDAEIGAAHAAISSVTGMEPVGFRGPGFSLTPAVLESLHRHGYRYDTTTLPTYIGPLARWYYFRGAELDDRQSEERAALFGSFRDGFQPNRPYRWNLAQGSILELPVTTFPIIKVPFHFSYLLYLSGRSPRLANAYFSSGLELCRRLGLGPTLLLHPLDFLDSSDAPQLEFFPGMDIDAETKMTRLDGYLDRIAERFDIGSMSAYVDSLDATIPVRALR
ncbi:MAG TPA: polysaccharide deacetylase family protein [Acidimicrobiia bacterium]|nr:polysaccharide deacetylase family protein [Acidimicrobiia bacterium]